MSVKELPDRLMHLKLLKEAISPGQQPILVTSHDCDTVIMPRASVTEHKSKEIGEGVEIKIFLKLQAYIKKFAFFWTLQLLTRRISVSAEISVPTGVK